MSSVILCLWSLTVQRRTRVVWNLSQCVLTLVGGHREDLGIWWETWFECSREGEIKKSLEKGRNRNIMVWYQEVKFDQFGWFQHLFTYFYYLRALIVKGYEMKNSICLVYHNYNLDISLSDFVGQLGYIGLAPSYRHIIYLPTEVLSCLCRNQMQVPAW